MPHTCRRELGPSDRLVVLATDGLWDVVDDGAAVKLAGDAARGRRGAACGPGGGVGAPPPRALQLGSMDNVLVVALWIDWVEADVAEERRAAAAAEEAKAAEDEVVAAAAVAAAEGEGTEDEASLSRASPPARADPVPTHIAGRSDLSQVRTRVVDIPTEPPTTKRR